MDAEAIAEWAATHLIAKPLAPHQVLLLEHMLSGQPLVIMTPHRPDRFASDLQMASWLAYLAAGRPTVTSEDQARQVYERATRLIDA